MKIKLNRFNVNLLNKYIFCIFNTKGSFTKTDYDLNNQVHSLTSIKCQVGNLISTTLLKIGQKKICISHGTDLITTKDTSNNASHKIFMITGSTAFLKTWPITPINTLKRCSML